MSQLKAGFHMIATIAMIAAITGKNVQQSLRLCGNHFSQSYGNQPIRKLLGDQSRHDRSTFLVAIVAIMWKPGLRLHQNKAICHYRELKLFFLREINRFLETRIE